MVQLPTHFQQEECGTWDFEPSYCLFLLENQTIELQWGNSNEAKYIHSSAP